MRNNNLIRGIRAGLSGIYNAVKSSRVINRNALRGCSITPEISSTSVCSKYHAVAGTERYRTVCSDGEIVGCVGYLDGRSRSKAIRVDVEEVGIVGARRIHPNILCGITC